ncbi:hypothetical protein TUM19329_24030 [Legionella antarctica]|uniref:Uncharacterized protein n=1 Tax=Legionella antarctica TaxID=2708020 RepID=A0A6F8T7N4_9GAMM|nr:hypothetical protein TUM19329_24030 [Legionella antarctica]
MDLQACFQLRKGYKLKYLEVIENKGWFGDNHIHFDDCFLTLKHLDSYPAKNISTLLVRQAYPFGEIHLEE